MPDDGIIVVTLPQSKETRGTYVYQAVGSDGYPDPDIALNTAYVRKRFKVDGKPVGLVKPPKAYKITLEPIY